MIPAPAIVDRSGEAGKTAKTGLTEGESDGARSAIAQTVPQSPSSCIDCGKGESRSFAKDRPSNLRFSNLHENNVGMLELSARKFEAEEGSRKLLEALDRYWLKRMAA